MRILREEMERQRKAELETEKERRRHLEDEIRRLKEKVQSSPRYSTMEVLSAPSVIQSPHDGSSTKSSTQSSSTSVKSRTTSGSQTNPTSPTTQSSGSSGSSSLPIEALLNLGLSPLKVSTSLRFLTYKESKVRTFRHVWLVCPMALVNLHTHW